MNLTDLGQWLLPPLYRATVRVIDTVARFEQYLDRWMEVLEL